MITFGSVCSGIEAASVAWNPLGWEAAWLAEIEAFPSSVLAHHYPDTPNLGDMTEIAGMLRNGDIPAPDILCGGTPCQAFSIAGLRNSLDDARGNLSLTFCEIANEIDIRRAADGLFPSIVFWENVPGVLNTKDNAFGCFLAGLAGEDDPLVAPGGKWPNAGVVIGPKRAIAWRVLDAQYFGVAQRRRRVFVVASARDGFDPAKILFEFDGVCRDIAPRREAGESVTHPVAPCLTSSGWGVERGGDTRGQDPVVAVYCLAHGQGGAEMGIDRSPTLTCNHEAPIAAYATDENGLPFIVGTLCADSHPGSYTGQDVYTGRLIPAYSVALRGRDGGATAELGGDVAGTLRASGDGGDKAHVLAFSCKDNGRDATPDLSPTPRSMGHSGSHANGGQMAVAYAIHGTQDPCVSDSTAFALGRNNGQENVAVYSIQAGALRTNPNSGPDGVGVQPNISYTLEARAEVQAVCITGNITHCLKAEGFDASEDGTGRGQPIVAVLQMAVRRLTPVECARLQGFPDKYLDITVRGKPAADGPKYKALGNSWAVPVVSWIGARIDKALQ